MSRYAHNLVCGPHVLRAAAVSVKWHGPDSQLEKSTLNCGRIFFCAHGLNPTRDFALLLSSFHLHVWLRQDSISCCVSDKYLCTVCLQPCMMGESFSVYLTRTCSLYVCSQM